MGNTNWEIEHRNAQYAYSPRRYRLYPGYPSWIYAYGYMAWLHLCYSYARKADIEVTPVAISEIV